MKIHSTLMFAAIALCGYSAAAFAQEIDLSQPNLALCDAYIENFDDDEEEDVGPFETDRTRLYDQETRERLTSEEAVMDALYEEKWDLSTREPIARNDLCEAEPNYIIHWSRMISKNETGKYVLLAEGDFSFRKDGTFGFVFNRRPYEGNWQFSDGQMTLQSDWINGGEPVTAPVEKVETPVEVTLSDGTVETYYEDAYRVGWLRFQRTQTTVRGQFRDCACSN